MRRILTALVVLAVALPCMAGWIFDGAPSEWEGIPEELQTDEYTFPVFVLELGGNWTDFELKASTNNFDGMVYFIMSSASNAVADDGDVWTYFTDDYVADVRKWWRAAVATWIGGQLADPVNSEVEYVYVFPSHDCAVDWRTWMSRDNEKLVWSYTRFDGVGFEMNATGTKTHWNPVQPIAWVKARTTP
ncbi:MAG: hypothetical protein QGH29_03235 [Kiritimatiellia bacterium]|jgi:hypothetical protein|nr:hypothetical protein [Kiritimatiellia bacterium]